MPPPAVSLGLPRACSVRAGGGVASGANLRTARRRRRPQRRLLRAAPWQLRRAAASVPQTAGWCARVAVGARRIALRAGARARPKARIRSRHGSRRELPRSDARRCGPGRALRVDARNGLAEPTVVHWHGLTIDTAQRRQRRNAGPRRPGARSTTRSRCAIEPASTGITRIRTARRRRRSIAACSASSPSRTTRSSPLRRALGLVPGDTEIPLVCTTAAAPAPDRYAPSAKICCTAGTATRSSSISRRDRISTSPRGATAFACSMPRMRASTASHYAATTARALPFLLIGTDGGLLEAPIARESKSFVAPAERVDVLVDFSGRRDRRLRAARKRAFDPMHAELHRAETASRHGGAITLRKRAATPIAGERQRRWRVRDPAIPRARPRGAQPPASRADCRAGRAIPRRRRRATAASGLRQRALAHQRPRLRHERDADRRRARGRRDVAHPQLPHEHAACDAPARLPVPRARAGNESRRARPLVVDARGRLATDLGWKDTVLVWPGESVRSRSISAIRSPATRSTSFIATTSSTRTAA